MQNFVIIGERQSGCQLLASLLNSHQEILCFGGIFGMKKDVRMKSLFGHDIPPLEEKENAVDYVKEILTQYAETNHKKVLGFNLNYIDCKGNNNWMPLWNEISKNKWHVIHLTRLNTLDLVISEKLNTNRNCQVRVTFDELEFYYKRMEEWQEKVTEKLKECPILHITYEMLIQKRDECCEKIQSFLKVKKQNLSGKFDIQQIGGQATLLRNYRHLYSQCLVHPIYKNYLTDIPIV